MKSAAGAKQLSTVVWLREHECPWSDDVTNIAAQNNDIEMLQYLRSDALVVNGQDQRCPWGIYACARAALYGHLEVSSAVVGTF
jgi:hypothetical protein